MSNNNKEHAPFSWKERLKSFDYSFQGIIHFFKQEHNARIHLVMAILSIVAGFWLAINAYEWIAIVLCIIIVLLAEMLNTAIERLCDAVHPTTHPLIKACKDVASGAVLLCAIGSVLIASIIFLPKIIALF